MRAAFGHMHQKYARRQMARLMRIWNPGNDLSCKIKFYGGEGKSQEGMIWMTVWLTDHIYFRTYGNNSFLVCNDENHEFVASLVANCPTGKHGVKWSTNTAEARKFIEEWMPFFRRNIWLCGFPIDSTPEERAAWVIGLTPREIEDWELVI